MSVRNPEFDRILSAGLILQGPIGFAVGFFDLGRFPFLKVPFPKNGNPFSNSFLSMFLR
jgi:hypothetical protein